MQRQSPEEMPITKPEDTIQASQQMTHFGTLNIIHDLDTKMELRPDLPTNFKALATQFDEIYHNPDHELHKEVVTSYHLAKDWLESKKRATDLTARINIPRNVFIATSLMYGVLIEVAQMGNVSEFFGFAVFLNIITWASSAIMTVGESELMSGSDDGDYIKKARDARLQHSYINKRIEAHANLLSYRLGKKVNGRKLRKQAVKAYDQEMEHQKLQNQKTRETEQFYQSIASAQSRLTDKKL